MTKDSAQGRLRERLDPAVRDRILAEVARLDAPRPATVPATEPGPSGLADLRAAVLAAQDELTAAERGPEESSAAPPAPPVADQPLPAAPAPLPEPQLAEIRTQDAVADQWSRLRTIPVDAARLERNLIIAAARTDPAHGAFDVLRTRMAQAMADRGWKRVGITSPTKGCGKSFTALNLAISLSRYGGHRTVLLDMDMRIPALARYLGVTEAGSIGDMLRGEVAPADHLRRFADNSLRIGAQVAIGLNDRREAYASELLQDPKAAAVLARIETDLAPDLMLFDMPPVLAQDDVIALRPHYDCILMIVAGGTTTARQIRESVRRIGEDKPILGVVLNKADGAGIDEYAY